MSTTARISAQKYERWEGSLDESSSSWMTIAQHGVNHAIKSPWLRLLMFLSLLLIVFSGFLFYALGQVEVLAGTPEARSMTRIVENFMRVDLSGVRQLENLRSPLWRTLLTMMVPIQLALVALMVAQVGPGLIARDLRSKALPIYFSKPVSPAGYLLGKWMTPAFFVGTATLVPSLGSVLIGYLVVGGLETWGDTIQLMLGSVACSLIIMTVVGSTMLCVSSLTSDRRYATVAWLGAAFIPMVVQAILFDELSAASTSTWLGSISLPHDVIILAEWVFDVRHSWTETGLDLKVFDDSLRSNVDVLYPAIVLGSITLLSLGIAYRRIIRFSRSATNL